MDNLYYWLGFFVGIIIAAAVGFYIRRKVGFRKYDERQIAAQGKAYKFGFFTVLILNTAVTLAEYGECLPGEVMLWHVAAMLVGVAVFACTAIHFDAYIALGRNPTRFLRTGGLLACSMATLGIGNINIYRSGGHRTANLEIGIINIMVAILWIVIVAALLIHLRLSKERDSE